MLTQLRLRADGRNIALHIPDVALTEERGAKDRRIFIESSTAFRSWAIF